MKGGVETGWVTHVLFNMIFMVPFAAVWSSWPARERRGRRGSTKELLRPSSESTTPEPSSGELPSVVSTTVLKKLVFVSTPLHTRTYLYDKDAVKLERFHSKLRAGAAVVQAVLTAASGEGADRVVLGDGAASGEGDEAHRVVLGDVAVAAADQQREGPLQLPSFSASFLGVPVVTDAPEQFSMTTPRAGGVESSRGASSGLVESVSPQVQVPPQAVPPQQLSMSTQAVLPQAVSPASAWNASSVHEERKNAEDEEAKEEAVPASNRPHRGLLSPKAPVLPPGAFPATASWNASSVHDEREDVGGVGGMLLQVDGMLFDGGGAPPGTVSAGPPSAAPAAGAVPAIPPAAAAPAAGGMAGTVVESPEQFRQEARAKALEIWERVSSSVEQQERETRAARTRSPERAEDPTINIVGVYDIRGSSAGKGAPALPSLSVFPGPWTSTPSGVLASVPASPHQNAGGFPGVSVPSPRGGASPADSDSSSEVLFGNDGAATTADTLKAQMADKWERDAGRSSARGMEAEDDGGSAGTKIGRSRTTTGSGTVEPPEFLDGDSAGKDSFSFGGGPPTPSWPSTPVWHDVVGPEEDVEWGRRPRPPAGDTDRRSSYNTVRSWDEEKESDETPPVDELANAANADLVTTGENRQKHRAEADVAATSATMGSSASSGSPPIDELFPVRSSVMDEDPVSSHATNEEDQQHDDTVPRPAPVDVAMAPIIIPSTDVIGARGPPTLWATTSPQQITTPIVEPPIVLPAPPSLPEDVPTPSGAKGLDVGIIVLIAGLSALAIVVVVLLVFRLAGGGPKTVRSGPLLEEDVIESGHMPPPPHGPLRQPLRFPEQAPQSPPSHPWSPAHPYEGGRGSSSWSPTHGGSAWSPSVTSPPNGRAGGSCDSVGGGSVVGGGGATTRKVNYRVRISRHVKLCPEEESFRMADGPLRRVGSGAVGSSAAGEGHQDEGRMLVDPHTRMKSKSRGSSEVSSSSDSESSSGSSSSGTESSFDLT